MHGGRTKNNTMLKKKGMGKYVTKEIVGQSLWTYLHTSVANKRINDDGLGIIANFVDNIQFTHPCLDCSSDFLSVLSVHPRPLILSRESVSIWICNLHNEINKRIGKDSFSCDLNVLDDFWGVDDPAATNILKEEDVRIPKFSKYKEPIRTLEKKEVSLNPPIQSSPPPVVPVVAKKGG